MSTPTSGPRAFVRRSLVDQVTDHYLANYEEIGRVTHDDLADIYGTSKGLVRRALEGAETRLNTAGRSVTRARRSDGWLREVTDDLVAWQVSTHDRLVAITVETGKLAHFEGALTQTASGLTVVWEGLSLSASDALDTLEAITP